MTLVRSLLAGDRLALSRALTQVENDTPQGRAILRALFPHTGRAHIIGVTGAPGTGKSSLVNQLAHHFRQASDHSNLPRVAILAVDPSSPFSGGALLGDRVRMRDLSGDAGVFIRSMASRGSLGGLAAASAGVIQVFDAAGFEVILVETVGAGQAEIDIARLAHTTLVVETPGLGDDIQAIKAGILEIADILVINKADLPGAEQTERALRSMLELAHPLARIFHANSHHLLGEERSPTTPPDHPASPSTEAPSWLPPIQCTIATQGVGIDGLAASIAAHRRYLEQGGGWQQRDRLRLQSELETMLQETLLERWRASISEGCYSNVLNALLTRQMSPYEAVAALLDGCA